MNDGRSVKIYGTADLPDGTLDRPRVTFALFSYNQENYLREAIEGAFSQTYSPLEIILSDDCSRDHTAELTQLLASTYVGPHKIKVIKNSENLGVLNHVLNVARLASGDILVVAAGDDVSRADRVEKIVNLFKTEDVVAACSSAAMYNSVSEQLTQDVLLGHDPDFPIWFAETSARYINGATAAYRRNFLLEVDFSPDKVHFEDLTFSTLAAIQDKTIAFTSEPLVNYRRNSGALTNNFSTDLSIEEIRSRTRRHAEMRLKTCHYLERYLEKRTFLNKKRIMNEIRKTQLSDQFIIKIYSETLVERFQGVYFVRSARDFRHVLKGFLGIKVHQIFIKCKKIFKKTLQTKKR